MQTSRREPIELARPVRALQVPSGEEIMLEAGCSGRLTQQLGSSFTVYIDGSLFRIDGVDADAIGKEPIAPKVYPEHPTDDEVQRASSGTSCARSTTRRFPAASWTSGSSMSAR